MTYGLNIKTYSHAHKHTHTQGNGEILQSFKWEKYTTEQEFKIWGQKNALWIKGPVYLSNVRLVDQFQDSTMVNFC